MGILAVRKGAVSKREAGREVNSEFIERFCKAGCIGSAINNTQEECNEKDSINKHDGPDVDGDLLLCPDGQRHEGRAEGGDETAGHEDG